MNRVFLDTETTGVHRGYRPWEIALIRRIDGADPDDDDELTIFVDIDDLDLCSADHAALQVGQFQSRHPQRGGALGPGQVLLSGAAAADTVNRWTDGALLFGINPSFDTIALDGLLARRGLESSWYYAPQDIAALARGTCWAADTAARRTPLRPSRWPAESLCLASTSGTLPSAMLAGSRAGTTISVSVAQPR